MSEISKQIQEKSMNKIDSNCKCGCHNLVEKNQNPVPKNGTENTIHTHEGEDSC